MFTSDITFGFVGVGFVVDGFIGDDFFCACVAGGEFFCACFVSCFAGVGFICACFADDGFVGSLLRTRYLIILHIYVCCLYLY